MRNLVGEVRNPNDDVWNPVDGVWNLANGVRNPVDEVRDLVLAGDDRMIGTDAEKAARRRLFSFTALTRRQAGVSSGPVTGSAVSRRPRVKRVPSCRRSSSRPWSPPDSLICA